MISGALNDTMKICEKESGEVVLCLWQSLGGQDLQFYDCLVQKKSFRASRTQEELEFMAAAFSGKRMRSADTNKIELKMKPKVLETLPVSLLAIAVLYSSQELN